LLTRTRAENFLNPSFGKMADVVHIVAAKAFVCSSGAVAGLDYTSVADANANLP